MSVAPPSRLPLYYFSLAHLSLAAAGLSLVVESSLLSGFFYQAPMMGTVHLVTLGWISGSILGGLYMVAPMALRTRLREGRVDLWICALYWIGVSGMVTHFWFDSWSAMMMSAGLVVLAIGFVGWRTNAALRESPVPLGVKLHLRLAFANLLLAAALALLLGSNKVLAEPLLPLDVMSAVYAHFHLAAVGWATMVVMGVGYRLLPMLLPAAMPGDAAPLASALLLELGVVGVAVGLLSVPELLPVAGSLAAAGVLVFVARMGLLLRARRPRARGLPDPDLGLAHVAQAFVYLVLSLGLGIVLGVVPPEAGLLSADLRLRLVPVYGVLVLLGFLSQMALGVGARLLPLYAWFRAYAASGGEEQPPPPYSATSRAALALVLLLFAAAVPLLAYGLFLEDALAVALAGGATLAAALVAAAHFFVQLRGLGERRRLTPR